MYAARTYFVHFLDKGHKIVEILVLLTAEPASFKIYKEG